jgi:DNA-binding transcriptional regulator LsrR (DeoR family)
MTLEEKTAAALRVARMYYYQDLTTETISHELQVSRSKVSRLLRFAKEQGLVEIRVRDPQQYASVLETEIKQLFNIKKVMVVSVPETTHEREWLDRVALFTANYLDSILHSNMILALAWGTTISAVSQHLKPKSLVNVDIVQLNGSGNTRNINNTYASEIIMKFANNYGARAHLFPVPTFFDYPETKQALWRERSVQRVLQLQQQADIMLYSIGSANSSVPSHVYAAGYLEEKDMWELEQEDVVGDIATVMFRKDGTYADIPLNARASGPFLKLFRESQCALCVVSGLSKADGLCAALKGNFLNELIVDEPTARALLELAH